MNNYTTFKSYSSLLFLTCLLCAKSFAQPRPLPPNYGAAIKVNYVRSWDANAPETNSSTLIARPLRDVKQTSVYSDGLGRVIQTVSRQSSLIGGGSPTDVIKASTFDELGREQFRYLPFVSTAPDGTKSDGSFKLNPFQQQASFFNAYLAGQTDETNIGASSLNWAYGQVTYEESPMSRTVETFSPGSSWVGSAAQALEANRRSLKAKYWINTALDEVRIWTVTEPSSIGSFGTYSSPGTYPAGALFKTVTVDETGKQVISFKDKSGKILLQKAQVSALADNGAGSNHSGWLCTYNIYDDLGNLRCIVTPRASELISPSWTLTDATILAEQCFRYEYDIRGRLIMEKAPGSGEKTYVYDSRDKLVMTQDAVMRASIPAKWMVTLYDKFDRPVQSGLWTEPNSLSYHLTQANASNGSDYPFSTSTIPGSGFERLSRIGYDRYTSFPTGTLLSTNFDNTYTTNSNYFNTTYNTLPDYAQPLTASTQIRGLVTWSETKVLNSTPAVYLYTINFYDDKGRVIQVKESNITGGIDVTTTQYGWNGNPIRLLSKKEKGGAPSEVSLILTMFTYDDLGRVIQVDKKVQNTNVNGNALPVAWTTISRNDFDELSKLKNKKIGTKKDPATGNYNGIPLETQVYDYNIRGWLLGINRPYVAIQGQSGTNRFGFELGYDKATNQSGQNFTNTLQYNGNITGLIWKSDGSDIRRKYDFRYDELKQLLKADFTQQNSDNSIWNNSQVNYTVQLGDGTTSASAYDANGNIKSMTQYGYKLGGNTSTPIDQLTYNYLNNNTSNKLLNVIDTYNDPQTKLGDFRTSTLHPVQTKTSTTVDYTYDLNGNVVKDFNKDIVTPSGADGLVYNHLNLVSFVTFKKDALSNKGTIAYDYDASGEKLRKTVLETSTVVNYNGTNYTTDVTTTTIYLGQVVYESKNYSNVSLAALAYTNRLQFIEQEEGRIRYKVQNNSLQYDYYLTDHLGNVRMVLTEEVSPASVYQATMESANRSTENQLFLNIPATESPKPGGFDTDAANQTVSKLFSITGTDKRVGPAVVLKVMAGDKFKALCSGWYLPGSTNNSTLPGATNIITNLLSAFTGGLPVGSKNSGSEVSGSGVLDGILSTFLNYQNTQNVGTRPKAFLNWMVLDDEQLKLVQGNYGTLQIPEITGVMQKQVMQAAGGADIEILKNGYLYVYVSNESQGNVYFDDLRVEFTKGSLKEETHYYPAGLQMAGISSQALDNQYIASEYKYQGQELENSLGYNMLEFEARMYDPQTGRWGAQDPEGQFTSPYVGMGNNWPNTTDPNGKYALIDDLVAGIVGGIVNLGVQLFTGNVHSVGQAFGFFGVGFVAGVSVEYGGPMAAGAISGFGNALVGGQSLKEAALSGGIGAITGVVAGPISNAVGAQISGVIGTSTAATVATNLGTSAIVGGGLGAGAALFTGGDVGQGFRSGALTGLVGGGIGMAAGAGVSALLTPKTPPPPQAPEPELKPAVPQEVPKTNLHPEEIKVKPPTTPQLTPTNAPNYTKNNYRANLAKKTGINPKNAQAHHDIPQKYRALMAKYGINVDDPKFLRWWQNSTHQKNAKAFNDLWASFLREVPNPTRIQVYRWVISARARFPQGVTGY